MKKILILFAHPAFEKSRANRTLIQAVQGLEGVTIHDLYEAYPEFDIDIEAEHRLLETHDLLVFHHPFFWYSTPAMLKEWQDLVLEHGWAYGSEGHALQGKKLFNAITTGGRESTYRKDGHNRFTMRELLAPIEQSVTLCEMEYLPPFVVHGTLGMPSQTILGHARDYRRLLEALRDEQVDLKTARTLPRLNANLDQIIRH